MNIGIVVYSRTGNTYSVALRLRDKLLELGHCANIERIAPVDEKQADIKKIRFDALPALDAYEALVFCSPVQGFSLSAVMSAYLTQITSVGYKKTVCFVTKGLRSAWTGGNRSIASMKRALASSGAIVCATGIVSWSSKRRDDDITEMVERLSAAF